MSGLAVQSTWGERRAVGEGVGGEETGKEDREAGTFIKLLIKEQAQQKF